MRIDYCRLSIELSDRLCRPIDNSKSTIDNSSLPLACFFQLANFALHQISLEAADAMDVQLPMQVIDLVLERAREQIIAGFLVPLAFDVLRADGRGPGAAYIFAKLWNAEAAFGLRQFAIELSDLRIDEHQLRIGIFLERDVNDSNAFGDTDLRRRKPDAVSRVHGLPHVIDKLAQFWCVELGDRFGLLFQNGVAKFNDRIDHSCFLTLSGDVLKNFVAVPDIHGSFASSRSASHRQTFPARNARS